MSWGILLQQCRYLTTIHRLTFTIIHAEIRLNRQVASLLSKGTIINKCKSLELGYPLVKKQRAYDLTALSPSTYLIPDVEWWEFCRLRFLAALLFQCLGHVCVLSEYSRRPFGRFQRLISLMNEMLFLLFCLSSHELRFSLLGQIKKQPRMKIPLKFLEPLYLLPLNLIKIFFELLK